MNEDSELNRIRQTKQIEADHSALQRETLNVNAKIATYHRDAETLKVELRKLTSFSIELDAKQKAIEMLDLEISGKLQKASNLHGQEIAVKQITIDNLADIRRIRSEIELERAALSREREEIRRGTSEYIEKRINAAKIINSHYRYENEAKYQHQEVYQKSQVSRVVEKTLFQAPESDKLHIKKEEPSLKSNARTDDLHIERTMPSIKSSVHAPIAFKVMKEPIHSERNECKEELYRNLRMHLSYERRRKN